MDDDDDEEYEFCVDWTDCSMRQNIANNVITKYNINDKIQHTLHLRRLAILHRALASEIDRIIMVIAYYCNYNS